MLMMHGAVVACLSVGCFVYVLFGGMVFYFLEKESQNESRKQVNSDLRHFVANFSCVGWKDLFNLLELVSPEYDKTWADISTVVDKQPTSWNYADSILLSTALISTVGFGTHGPKTDLARAVRVLYAIFGITLLIIAIHALGVKTSSLFHRLDKWIAPGAEHRSCSLNKWLIRLRYLMTVAAGLLLFLIGPAVITSWIEQLTFNQSLYAVFITLSTIGLKEGIPISSDHSANFWIYFPLFCCWLYFGLVFIFLLLLAIIRTTNRAAPKRLGDEIKSNPMTEKQYGTLGLSDCSKELFETSSTASLRSSASSIVNLT